MPRSALQLRATMLPYGDAPCDLWIDGGHVRTHPIDGAERLAPEGGYVLPGLVDAHVHLVTNRGYRELPAGSREVIDRNRGDFLRRGVLLLRDMGAFTRREADRPATLGLPRDDGLPPVIASGQPLAPEGVFTGIQEATTPGQLAEHATRRARDQHAPWVKVILGNFPPHLAPPVDGVPGMVNYREPELRAATEAVHAAGARIAVHAFTREAAAAAIAAGVDSLEHGWGLDGDLVEEMARRGIAWTPTLALDAMMLDMAGGGRDQPPSAAVERWLREAVDRIEPLIVQAQRLGIPLLAGTDGVEPVTREVARLHEAGLDPADALATASSAARELLGEPGLEDGAPADLVWFADDPRESPELLERPQIVLLRGERIELAPG